MDFNHFVLMFAVAVSFSIFGYALGKSSMEDAAIKRGYAIHCPLDGKFSWINECPDELPNI